MEFGNRAMTLTFGDRAENHEGMQMLGSGADGGFSYEDLAKIKESLDALGYGEMCELIDLRELAKERPEGVPEPAAAYLLVIRGFLTKRRADDIFKENMSFEWDKKLWNWKQKVVQDKHARHNVCYDDEGQEANFPEGKGTIIAWKSVPATHAVLRVLPVLLGEKGEDLVCEGNLYYDVDKTGIGWHGDKERKKVVGVRFGKSIPLKFRWWYRNKSFGETLSLSLFHGDAYIMSEKAVGWDWGCPVKHGPTLRHSAGCEKYTKVTK
tara:strand:+ start:420 stop:1217 length:798 start_codon:yes stop_codon:yes gene_type:complete